MTSISLPSTSRSPLDRELSLSWLRTDVLLFVLVLLASIFAHLYGLGRMAMHHDESIHAWMSWKLYSGSGDFTCAGGRSSPTYCYDPVYHGPSLYAFTALAYFLFGEGELQARLPQAMAGIAMTASVWWLRPYLGRTGTIIAALLLTLSPTLLYYTRFARHDGLMVLWTLWIVIGFIRFVDTRRVAWLSLLAVGTALAMATHELYYILGFIFGSFLLIRIVYEQIGKRQITTALLIITALAAFVEALIIGGIWSGQITSSLRADGLALLFVAVAGSGALAVRIWDPRPFVSAAFVDAWRTQRRGIFTAIALFAAIFVVLYSMFFADPRGVLDGLYQGLAYWLGSQQEFKRGDQPWYYYLMMMPLYEPAAFFGSFAALVYLFFRPAATQIARVIAPRPAAEDTSAPVEPAAPLAMVDGVTDSVTDGSAAADELPETRPLSMSDLVPQVAVAPAADEMPGGIGLFPILLVFWFIGSLVIFSWAGEKMPWLNAHIALPANLLLAWGLARLVAALGDARATDRRVWLVPPAVVLLVAAIGVALWRFGDRSSDLAGQSSLLQALLPLAIAGGLIYGLLSLASLIGRRAVLVACTLSVMAITGIYIIRAAWMVVYAHPDTPRELMIYTQTSPDVPLIVREMHELAIAQTRNVRSAEDPAGGLTMPVMLDNGDPENGGEGSLAWPMQWYLRNFQRTEYRDAAFFRSATPESFLVDPAQGGGEKVPAPMILVSNNHVTEQTRTALEANHVKRYDSKLNWWFPEGSLDRCDLQAPGYSRFYYAYPSARADYAKKCLNGELSAVPALPGFWAPLLWPFDSSHWDSTRRYLMYRDLPAPLTLEGREMQVWVRRDLAGGGGSTAVSSSAPATFLAAQTIAAAGAAAGELAEPRGVALDAQGRIYVADTANHRIQRFTADGTPDLTIGTLGAGDGQFNEPRGIAVDAQGNIYVADTWNARVVKLNAQGEFVASWGEGQDFGNGRVASQTDGTLAGNAAQPLGFFGPRSVAVDAQGRVYVADTGNKRVVVTDGDGNFLFQWGAAGAGAGQFDEPVGIAVDAQGLVYVADTWNGRVQVFAPDADGVVSGTPVREIRVIGWAPQTYDDPFVAVSAGGTVVAGIPAREQLAVYDASGREIVRFGGESSDQIPLGAPGGIVVAADGAIIVADRSNGRIVTFRVPLPGLATP